MKKIHPKTTKCCGAVAVDQSEDMGLCPDCKDHTEYGHYDEDGNEIEWEECDLCYGTGFWSFLPGHCGQCHGTGLIDSNYDSDPSLGGEDYGGSSNAAREVQLRDYNQKL